MPHQIESAIWLQIIGFLIIIGDEYLIDILFPKLKTTKPHERYYRIKLTRRIGFGMVLLGLYGQLGYHD